MHTIKNLAIKRMLSLKNTFCSSKLLIIPFAAAILSINLSKVSAHKVKTDTDVGATLHIEPNDNPKAGKPAKVWFALTRKGGKVIPLEKCDCNLQVYKEPVKQQNLPVLKPSLEPVSAEKYQGIPGVKMTFPTPGTYQLRLSGKPKGNAESFQPFELKFPVTVAVGKTVTEKEIETQTPKVSDGAVATAVGDRSGKSSLEDPKVGGDTNTSFPLWLMVIIPAIALGVVFIALGRFKSNKDG